MSDIGDESKNSETSTSVSPANNSQQINSNPNGPKILEPDTVNDLVRVGKEKAYKKGYEAALAEFSKNNVENNNSESIPQSIQNSSSPSNFDENRYRSMISEEMRKLHEEEAKKQEQKLLEENARRLFSELHQKVEMAKSRYPDYDEVTKVLNIQEIPEILAYANEADNAGDILYDLAKNPSKIATLRSLPPQLAIHEINKLSNSIKTNQEGSKESPHRPPLEQLKPTSVNHGDAPLTLRDYKKIYTV
ncbi:hypothetical protein [Flavobacterium sp.]|uniref:hypothetical protein n=1 Tax=Flavobacterium sp. TaxID=239 RepID=UPI003F69C45F